MYEDGCVKDALVLSAGGMWTAWEVGAWMQLRERFKPDLIVGASAGAWLGWMIAGGATPEDLRREFLDPHTGKIFQFGLHSTGMFRGQPLEDKARELFERYRPQIPFALTIVQLPSFHLHAVRESEITWQHLAATCAIPFGFPPVVIEGRRYVDGGLRAGLPLWAAESLGARRAVALNVLSTPGFRVLQTVLSYRRASAPLSPASVAMEVIRVEPSERLGWLRDAYKWNAKNIERWIELGRRDASSTKIVM
jgi:NTE family protein